MSRIGKKTIKLESSHKVDIGVGMVTLTGPKGTLKVNLPSGIKVSHENSELSVTVTNKLRQTKAYHGLVRSLLNNAVIGTIDGYQKTLKLVGTGYRVQSKGRGISLAVGFSHSVDYQPPQDVTLKVEGNNIIHIEGIDKQAVGQVAANIRALRPPEPYKGKGIRYDGEIVRLKPGKAAATTTK